VIDRVKDHAIVLLTLRGKVMTQNPGAEKIHGYTEERAVGQHLSLFYPPEDRAQADDALCRPPNLNASRVKAGESNKTGRDIGPASHWLHCGRIWRTERLWRDQQRTAITDRKQQSHSN
jgi:PAS domain-containing protein